VVLRVDGVHKSFGQKVVMQGLSFQVERGQTYVILGPSGTGKSVTLKMIVGLLAPDRGEIWVGKTRVNGAKPAALDEVRSRIGYLFQSGALINWMSVAENVALPLTEFTRLRHFEVDRRVEEYLAMVRMLPAKYQMPAELSGGQKRRVALARVLAGAPSIILYDEPTAGLDPIMTTTISQLIRQVQRKLGVTSILVTHDLDCAYEAGDRIAMIDGGQVVLEAEVEEFRNTRHPVVRNFLLGGRDETGGRDG
jgi:phospholipid/cholesterol/gamma-HCH transport system ATP-binding protein